MAEKTHVLSIRVSEEVKQKLEEKASAQAMELTQYVKYLLANSVEEQVIDPNRNNIKDLKCLQWLEENYKLIGRMITDGYFKTDAMAKDRLDPDYIKSVKKTSDEFFMKQGIQKNS